jgi:hypothetical protein
MQHQIALREAGSHTPAVRRGRRFDVADWTRADLEAQRARLRDVPIEERLEEVLAWSAALLADELERSDGKPAERPFPTGLGHSASLPSRLPRSAER